MSSATPPLSDSFPLTAARRDAPEIVLAHRETLRLFDECGPRLRRYVRSCGVADGAADDVVQEVFLALFRHLCLGRPRDNLAAWLYQVAFRTAVRYRHRAQDRMAVEEGWGLGLEDALRDTTGDPETALVDRERRRRIQRVVRALPDRSRQCLAMRAEGLRYRDIAKMLQLSLGGVAKAIDLAVRRLSRAVKE